MLSDSDAVRAIVDHPVFVRVPGQDTRGNEDRTPAQRGEFEHGRPGYTADRGGYQQPDPLTVHG